MREFANFSAETWLLRVTGRAGLAMLFAAVLAFLAPFGTYRFDAIGRVGYWTVQMAAWLILSQTAAWIAWRMAGLRSQGAVQRRILATAMATLPMVVVTGVANNMMNGWLPNAGDVIELFLSIALIGGGYTYVSDRLVEGATEAHAGRERVAATPGMETAQADDELLPADGPSDTALMERLPPHIRGEILCLQVEDHYVRVHSRNSSAMVLMRFSDALRGIDHIPGSQVHRSWWVASHAVTGLRRTGRTAQLTLANGASVPVSQPYLAHALRSWGSLEANAA
jgi:DNA-binding LytR/AlgR family response regulator